MRVAPVIWRVRTSGRPSGDHLFCRVSERERVGAIDLRVAKREPPVYQVGDVMNEIVGKSGDFLDSDLAEVAADYATANKGGISNDIDQMKLDDD